jgi:hypothetical protein
MTEAEKNKKDWEALVAWALEENYVYEWDLPSYVENKKKD